MKVSVVLNSSAGTLRALPVQETVEQVEHGFQAAGHHVVCSAAPGKDIERSIKAAVEGDAEVIVVGGGDGTIATAARLLTGTGKALGVLPLGTMNLLARDLGIPFTLDEAIRALADGRIESIDMAELNGKPFLNNSVIGLYPRMVEVREHHRHKGKVGKWPAMTLAFVKTLIDYPRLEVTLEIEGRQTRVLTPMVAVANNAYDAGNGPIPTRADLSGGVLAVYVGRHRGRLEFLRLFGRIFAGIWQGDPRLQVHMVSAVTVGSRRRTLRVANDGEVEWISAPLSYRIIPGGLRVLRPVAAADEKPLELRTSA